MRITESQLRRIVRQEASRLQEGRQDLPPDFDAYLMQALKAMVADGFTGFEVAEDIVHARVDKVMEEFERWCFENGINQVSSRRM